MRFSIVIPAYNVKDYLEKCVLSVVGQTCGDWEAILVDDGSTDGATGEMCIRDRIRTEQANFSPP